MADHQLRLPGEAAAAAAGEGQQQQQQQRSGSGGGGWGSEDVVVRPSFTEYWREEKEGERAGRVQFVSEGQQQPLSSLSGMVMGSPPPLGEQQQGSSESPPGAGAGGPDKSKEKAKLRRQQVRKAQIQHRTRKANYIKQLELDVCKFRDLIAAAEKEVLAYSRENEGMKGALSAAGFKFPEESSKGRQSEVVVDEVRILEEAPAEAPVYQQQEAHTHEQRAPAYVEPQQQQQQYEPQQEMGQAELRGAYPQETMVVEYEYDPYPPVDIFPDVNMGDIIVTMRKDDTLGTPCFQISPSASSRTVSPRRPAAPDQISPEQEIIAINLILSMEHICWNHFHPRQYPRHADPVKAASGHTMMASTMCMSSAPERVYRSIRRRETEAQHAWEASTGAGSALSLRSLLALARTLNPGDIELTPVQAWFELAARYGAAPLMEERVVEALKREFCGVVDCIHFGAIIERDAFESVVARVMGEAGVPELPYEMDVELDAGTWVGGMDAGSQRQIAA